METDRKKIIRYAIYALLCLVVFFYSCTKEYLIPAIFSVVMFNVWLKELAQISYKEE
jgi:hypothetical protein